LSPTIFAIIAVLVGIMIASQTQCRPNLLV
jgi:hypothetical protein